MAYRRHSHAYAVRWAVSQDRSRGIDVGEFFAMGKYGTYVWFAYGITLVGLLLLFIWSWYGARAREAELEQVRQWARADRKAPSSAALGTVAPPASDIDAESMPAADPSGSGA